MVKKFGYPLKFIVILIAVFAAAVPLHVAFADDHGDSCGSATTVGTASNTNGSISPAADKDYFKIQLPSDGLVSLWTLSDMDTVGELRDASCFLVTSDTCCNDFFLSQQLVKGTYYIVVRHYSSSGTGPYTLHVEGDFDNDDHGNSCGSSTPVNVRSSSTLGNLSVYGDTDYFRLDLPSDGLVTMSTTSDTWTVGELRNTNCFVIKSDTCCNDFLLSEWLTKGTYYLSVKNYDKDALAQYAFNVEGDFEDDDHGNGCSSATLYAGAKMSGQLSTYNDKDYFKIVLPADGAFRATSTSDQWKSSELRDSNCFSIATDTGYPNIDLEQELEAGTYYLEIRNYEWEEKGGYTLKIKFPCSGKPAKPQLLNPANGGSITKKRVKLDWSDVECAANYKVQVRQGSPGGAQVAGAESLAASNFKTPALTGGVTYYWQVQACSTAGCKKSVWSSFYIN